LSQPNISFLQGYLADDGWSRTPAIEKESLNLRCSRSRNRGWLSWVPALVRWGFLPLLQRRNGEATLGTYA
jgi:hypothetical protein